MPGLYYFVGPWQVKIDKNSCKLQRLRRQNRHMGLWPLAFKILNKPVLKLMGYCSDGVGQKKRNLSIFTRNITSDIMLQFLSWYLVADVKSA